MTKLLFGTKFLLSGAVLALVAAAPASAQLLGGRGGGGLGGGLGGSMGGLGGGLRGAGSGSLGGTFDGAASRIPATGDIGSRTQGSARADKQVNARKGSASASAAASGTSMVDGATSVAGRSFSGSGSASGSGSGSADAQLIGTDAVGSAARSTVGTGRGLAAQGRSVAGSAASSAKGYASSAGNVAGAATTAAKGSASGALGQLAAAGSAAANGAGAFNVAPGMAVTDAKGRVIGTVSNVRSTAQGSVHEVMVTVGKQTATLPAANFTGSGNVLVSAIGKGDLKSTAKQQSTN